MGKFYEVICTAVSCTVLSLSLMFSSCAHDERRATRADTASQKTIRPAYDETAQLAERVVKLSKDLFPHEPGVIYLGKSQKGSDEYAVINVSEENGIKTLDISLYLSSDVELEAKINEYLLDHDYESVAEALRKSSLSMTRFRDLELNGLITIKDLLEMRDKEGEYTATSAKQFDLLGANDVYRTLLKLVLEKELKMREK